MIINCQMLAGEKLEHILEAHIGLEGSKISFIGDGFVSGADDLRSLLAIPGLVNAHTHIGDSFAKDACIGLSVQEAVGRGGMKWKLYEKADKKEVIAGMRDSAKEMLYSGITSYADFREGSHGGLKDLKEATNDLPIRTIALGRDLGNNLEDCDGLGLNLYQTDQIPGSRNDLRDKIIAIHAGEVPGEVEAALKVDPDIIVHCTNCTREDIRSAADKGISIIVCPRSNASLRVGFPPVRELIDAGINVALGTDNVMINSPDMWSEMEFLYRASQLFEGLTPLEVLKIASVNGGRGLGENNGAIEKGKQGDLIFIDIKAPNMRGSRDIHASIVNRCRKENIVRILVNGKNIADKEGIIYIKK
jgi:cytosine/adenosine deaminase-related metal-dependent hydrolase